jgi:hypothetical protein
MILNENKILNIRKFNLRNLNSFVNLNYIFLTDIILHNDYDNDSDNDNYNENDNENKDFYNKKGNKKNNYNNNITINEKDNNNDSYNNFNHDKFKIDFISTLKFFKKMTCN